MQKGDLDTDLTCYIKTNSKETIELNVKCKNIKLLKVNIGENRHDLGFCGEFLDTLPKAQNHEEKNKLSFIKIKSSALAKDTIKLMKRQDRLGENIFKIRIC